MLGLNGRWMMLGVAWALAGGCTIEDPAAGDVERLLDLLCERTEACRCAGTQDMNACEVRRDTWDERLSYGRAKGLVYDPACVEAIESRVGARACLDATTDEGGHLCDEFCAVFHGNVEIGGSCEAHDAVTSDCVQGATCLEQTCVDPCDALAGLPEGAPCRDEDGNEFDDCAENLVCDFDSRRCLPLPGVGQPCLSGDCNESASCDHQSNICRAAAQVGERCDVVNCVEDAYCQWDESGGTCRADRTQGQSCRDAQCADGLRCDYDRDACLPPAGEGRPCAGGCEEGLECIESTCQQPPEQGEPCPTSVCAQGLWCDWNLDGRCAPLPDGEGQPCPVGECAGRLWCDTSNDPNGECRIRAPFGEPCTGHRQCETGFCPAGFCDELPLEGDDCQSAGGCANGLVCDGEVCVTALSRGSAVCSYAGW